MEIWLAIGLLVTLTTSGLVCKAEEGVDSKVGMYYIVHCY